MNLYRIALVLCIALFGNTLLSQTVNYDFEGTGALTGWVRNDGLPLTVGPGASGAGALAVVVNEAGSGVRAYHTVPFDPTKAYRYSAWTQSSDTELSATMRLAWVDFSTGMTIYTDTYYMPCGLNGWKATGVHPHRLPAGDFSSNPNAQFCIVLEAGGNASGTVWLDDVRITRSDPANSAFLWVNVMLGGAYTPNSGTMSNNLRNAGLIPQTEPYTALGYPPVGGGSEQAPPAWWGVSTLDGPVDWVRIELRSAVDPAVIVATRHGLVSSIGHVTEVDGCSAIGFNVPAGNYYVAARHRNHLGVMTSAPVAVSAPIAIPWTGYSGVNFTSGSTATWGTDAQKVGDTIYNYRVLWPGDVTRNGAVKYTGTGNDRDPILVAVGSTTPNNTVANVYSSNDVNLDGQTKYTGPSNDRDLILQQLNGSPNTVRIGQLP